VRAGKATVYPARPNQRRSSGNKGLARRHRGPIGARVGFSAGLQQGAEIGLAVQYSLAILHLYGYGVPQSLIEARIASPEMLLNINLLPHLICSFWAFGNISP